LVAAGEITAAERDAALLRKNRLTHRAQVGLAFVETLGAQARLRPDTDALDPDSLARDPVYQAARKIVAGVTDDPATRDAVLAYLATGPSIEDINNADLVLHPS
jgi:hypothetical protein